MFSTMIRRIRVIAPAHARLIEASVPLAIWSQMKTGMDAWGPVNGLVLIDCERNVVSSSGAV